MIMRVSARSQAEDSADGKPRTRHKLGTGRGSETHTRLLRTAITSPVLAIYEKIPFACHRGNYYAPISVRTYGRENTARAFTVPPTKLHHFYPGLGQGDTFSGVIRDTVGTFRTTTRKENISE